MKFKKVLYVIAMAMIIIACAGFIFKALGEDLSTDIVTAGIIYFTFRGVYSFIQERKG